VAEQPARLKLIGDLNRDRGRVSYHFWNQRDSSEMAARYALRPRTNSIAAALIVGAPKRVATSATRSAKAGALSARWAWAVVSKWSACLGMVSGEPFATCSRRGWNRKALRVSVAQYPSQYYVGLTNDVAGRVVTHNAGGSLHTSKYRPWRLTVSIEFEDQSQATAFERYLKTGSGRAFARRHFRWITRSPTVQELMSIPGGASAAHRRAWAALHGRI